MWCSRVSTEVSDAMCFPRVAEGISSFVHVAVAWRHWGSPLFGRRLPSSVLRWKASLLLVLRCYCFMKSCIHLARFLSPMLKGECPAELPGRPQMSKWLERAIFELVTSFKQTDFSAPPAAEPIKLCPRTASWSCSRHLRFNLSRERYTYRSFIRAVIIHYDAKV